jgi:hypothetical protein
VAPLWDGSDCAWANRAEFITGDPDMPMVADSGAFVAGRTLVAAVRDRVAVILPGDDLALELRLTDAVLTARIAADGMALEEVTLAGRWGRSDLLMSLGQLGLCPGSMSRMLLSGSLDETLDIRAMPGTGGPEVNCDALSVALRWTGTPVTFAGVAAAEALPAPCAGMRCGSLQSVLGRPWDTVLRRSCSSKTTRTTARSSPSCSPTPATWWSRRRTGSRRSSTFEAGASRI